MSREKGYLKSKLESPQDFITELRKRHSKVLVACRYVHMFILKQRAKYDYMCLKKESRFFYKFFLQE